MGSDSTCCDVFTVDDQQVCSNAGWRLMIVQGALADSAAVMVESTAFPIMQQRRAVVLPHQCGVYDVFHAAQFTTLCLRDRYQCSLAVRLNAEVRILSNAEIFQPETGMCLQGQIERLDDTDDDAESVSSSAISTAANEADDTDINDESDDSSLMSITPSWLAQYATTPAAGVADVQEDEVAHVWEMEDEDVDDDIADVTPHFADILTSHLNMMQRLNDGDTYTVVTFGIGLVDVGRRDFVTTTPNPTTMLEQICRLWRDHVGRANVQVFLVRDQPEMQLDGEYIVLLVAFQYQTHPPEAILFQQVDRDMNPIDSRPHAIRINAEATAFGLLCEAGLDQDVYPQGVRDSTVRCKGRMLPREGSIHYRNGDFCQIYIGSYPQHITHASTRFANAERFFRDMRWTQQEYAWDMVICRMHGISPNGQHLDARDLYLEHMDFCRDTWITQALEMWPFDQACTMMAYSHWEDSVTGGPYVFHFVTSFANTHQYAPILVRQVIYAEIDDTAQYETIACNVPIHMTQDDLRRLVLSPPFWPGFQHTQRIDVRGPDQPRTGSHYDVWFQVRTREDILLNLLRASMHSDDDVPDTISMLQMTKNQKSQILPKDEFVELCLMLTESCGDGQDEKEPQPEDNSNLRSGQNSSVNASEVMEPHDPHSVHDDLQTLHEALEVLQQPWTGLNDDWTQLPNLHPMAQWAIESTQQASTPGRKLHIFTDGSSKAGLATWAFVVVCQDETLYGPVFHRIGYAAGFVQPDVSQVEGNAQDAEATALVAMAEFVLSQELDQIELHCHFDSTAAGWGALGRQEIPKWHDSFSPRQKLARILLSLVERKCAEVQGFHIHAHEGCPYNECADSIAGAVRTGWKPQVEAQLRSKILAEHTLRDWAWIDIAPSNEVPSLSDMLHAPFDRSETGWLDRTLRLSDNNRQAQVTCDVRVATLNVGTLNYAQEQHEGCSHKVRELQHQFNEQGCDIIAIQESRARHSQTIDDAKFCRLVAAGSRGSAGVELWLRKEMFRKMGHDLDPSKDLCAWFVSERILAVTVDCDVMQLSIVVCYMPQSGCPIEYKEATWKQLSEVLSACPNTYPMIVLGDMNARIGSVENDYIGGLHPDIEDEAGELFRQLCAEHALIVCNTQASLHQGMGWTYQDHRGTVSRLDYVAVSDDVLPGVVATWVDQTIETLNGDHDHRPVVMHLQLTQRLSQSRGYRRRISYDRTSARKAKHAHNCNLFEHIPSQPWERDANAHWSYVRDCLQDLAPKYHPRPKRQQRQVYFSEACWNLVCERKDLRQAAKAQTRDLQFHMLSRVFQAWRGGSDPGREQNVQLCIHTARLQLSLTQLMRERVDRRFRNLKRQEWKSWVTNRMHKQLEDLSHAPSQLFQILQPKRMITKAENKHRKALPGFKDRSGQWVTSKPKIAWAWQAQFSEIENAVEVQVQELYNLATNQKGPELDVQHLSQIPTLYDFESSLRRMKDSKAPGLDGIGAEIFQVDIPAVAKRLYPIFLKSVLRGQALPDLSGGWLIPLFKQKGSAQAMSGYRAIMLEPVLARTFARAWRGRLEDGLSKVAAPLQYGGRRGLAIEAVHLCVKLWQCNAVARRQSVTLLFMDIRSAFYSVVKPLLTGFDGNTDALIQVFQMLNLPPEVFQTFMQTVAETSLVREATNSSVAQKTVANILNFSWFALPDGQTTQMPKTGSKPGDPIADLLFGMLMSKILDEVQQRFVDEGIVAIPDNADNPEACTATWVDDVACAITAPAEVLISKTQRAVSLILDVLTEHGLRLTFGVGKTAVLPSFHGPKAVASRQDCEQRFPVTMPVCSEYLGVVDVPLTNHYKHLGGMIMRAGNLLPEIRIRGATTQSKLKPLRKILSNDQVSIQHRRTLLTTMGMSVVTLHTGTWFDMKWGEYHAWKAAIYHAYRSLQPGMWNADNQCDFFHLALQANSPMPLELLHLNRLRLWVHLIQVSDDFMIAAVLNNFRWAKEKSWLHSVLNSFQWLKEQVSTALVPPEIDHLEVFQTWKDLQPHVRYFKKLLRKARHCHMLRVKTLCQLQDHAKFQHEVWRDMNCEQAAQPKEDDNQEKSPCPQCGKCFPSQAALAVHQTKAHKQKMAIRRFATDPSCRVCARYFHTRSRLLTHWQYGSTPCWIAIMRTFRPMSEHEACQLDEEDKRKGQALHQKGIKSVEVDCQWRQCTAEELTDALPRHDGADTFDTSLPSDIELQQWSDLGMLPPGQGGRPRTIRQLDEPQVCNVIAATRQFEKQMCREVCEWEQTDDWIPRPLSLGERYVLVLFSGHRRYGDICSWLEWDGRLRPIPIDLAISKQHGNAFDCHLWERLIRARKVVGAHSGPPCETYTEARWLYCPELPEDKQPRPLRDTCDPWGMTDRRPDEVQQVSIGTWLMLIALRITLLVLLHGGCSSLEHPRGPVPGGRRWCIWHSAFVAEILKLRCTRTCTFMQGPLGKEYAKPTTLLLGRMHRLPGQIFASYQPHWRPTQVLGGRDGSTWKTTAAKAYPSELSRLIANAFLEHSEDLISDGETPEPDGLSEALANLTKGWDPYLQDAQGHMMQSDYNPHVAQG